MGLRQFGQIVGDKVFMAKQETFSVTTSSSYSPEREAQTYNLLILLPILLIGGLFGTWRNLD
jgi:hypothetical protein